MFVRVFIIQCRSTGEFLTVHLQYTHSFKRAGLFSDRQAALDTGVSCLGSDFEVHDFYKKEHDLPAYVRPDACPRAVYEHGQPAGAHSVPPR